MLVFHFRLQLRVAAQGVGRHQHFFETQLADEPGAYRAGFERQHKASLQSFKSARSRRACCAKAICSAQLIQSDLTILPDSRSGRLRSTPRAKRLAAAAISWPWRSTRMAPTLITGCGLPPRLTGPRRATQSARASHCRCNASEGRPGAGAFLAERGDGSARHKRPLKARARSLSAWGRLRIR